MVRIFKKKSELNMEELMGLRADIISNLKPSLSRSYWYSHGIDHLFSPWDDIWNDIRSNLRDVED